MRSYLPKALHKLGGRPMVESLIARAKEAGASRVYVVAGFGIEEVRKALVPARGGSASGGKGVVLVHQKQQWGSGHAVAVAEKALARESGELFVLYCDTPLLTAGTLRAMLQAHRRDKNEATLLSVEMDDATGYGRILRDRNGSVERIVEHQDATEEEKAVREVNAGCYVFDKKGLFEALRSVKKNPKKKEYYLTDAVAILAQRGSVRALASLERDETLGVNTRVELAKAEEIVQKRLQETWMERGVSIRDPKTTFIDSDVRLGQDTILLPHTVIEEGSVIGERCVIGPFARIRGASRIGDRAVIGNFVEIVRSKVGRNTQIKHLSYIGDSEIGEGVNIGAGTITANFDGKAKHKTVIRNGAQIGSGTVFVAPVTVGKFAKTGAGAVVTKGTRMKDRSVYVGVPARELKKGKK